MIPDTELGDYTTKMRCEMKAEKHNKKRYDELFKRNAVALGREPKVIVQHKGPSDGDFFLT